MSQRSTPLRESVPDDWGAALAGAMADERFARLGDFLVAERERDDTAIYPPATDVFAALRMTPLATVRAVIIGQDPYHGEGQAHGLAFSCLTRPWPPSLANIFREWQRDLDRPGPPSSGSLEPWARNGVLLLNTLLTVRRGSPDSHRRHGWEQFTDAVVAAVAARPEPVAFLLWGRKAQEKAAAVSNPHFVLKAAHPSPYSVAGFRETRPFSTANRELERRRRPPIDWSLPTD